jgi:hypothetical protein
MLSKTPKKLRRALQKKELAVQITKKNKFYPLPHIVFYSGSSEKHRIKPVSAFFPAWQTAPGVNLICDPEP